MINIDKEYERIRKDNLAIAGIKFYFAVIKSGIDYDVKFTQKKIISLLGISEYIWRKHYNILLLEFRRENGI